MIKTDFPGFMRDDTPGQARAVLNTDSVSYAAFKEARAKDRALSQVMNDVNNLQQDMGEIKSLLLKLLDGTK